MADLCRVVHEIPPVYDARSRVLILGTIPSPKSREYGFFYGHPQNRFWKVLAALFQSPVPQTNEQKRGFLLDRRIALWDVLAACEIEGASDASIKNATPTSPPSCKPPASGRSAPPAQRPLPFIESIHSRRLGFPRWRCLRPAPQTAPVRLNPSAPAIK